MPSFTNESMEICSDVRMVGVVEVTKAEIMEEENAGKVRVAIDREINQMKKRRFVDPTTLSETDKKRYIKPEDPTVEQKKHAMECRLSITKRILRVIITQRIYIFRIKCFEFLYTIFSTCKQS